jgi:Mg2+ and Co2+ transporter CorA
VIRLLAIHYQLHPLAVEDCLHTSARSKSEYYKQHLFVHAAVHTLEESPDLPNPSTTTLEKRDSKPSATTDQPLEGGILDPEIDPTDSVPTYKSTDHTHETADQPIMDLGTATNSHGLPGKVSRSHLLSFSTIHPPMPLAQK